MLQYTMNKLKYNLDRLPTQTIRLRRNVSRTLITRLHGGAAQTPWNTRTYNTHAADTEQPANEDCSVV